MAHHEPTGDAASPERREGDYRSLSLWLDLLPGDLTPRPRLQSDIDVDVVIVGGGFTGLWLAYYLTERQPDLRIAVLEREICGFGASGRNGGWCIAELAAGVDRYAAIGGHESAMRLMRALAAAVDEVGRVAEAEAIDCGFAKGGAVFLARNPAQAKRQVERIATERAHGFGQHEIRSLTAEEATAMVGATDVLGGIHFSAAAAIDPARLVRGLAQVVEARGVKIHEGTAARSVEAGTVRTEGATVRAEVVVLATEGYTSELSGRHRAMLPIYSLMVATEPLDRSVFETIGMADRPTFADDRYAVIYGQRTADDRIAFGGRGIPYRYGNRIDPATERHRPTHELVHQTLIELFPQLADVAITHRWGGVLGATRNWTPSVSFDRSSGFATGGGYVGEGVCAANLAGQTLADLIVGADSDSELVSLPWVNVRSRDWEPEPLRWLGIRGTRRAMQLADTREYDSGRESRLGRWASKLLS
ncbi:MAG: NAD(P)/FAD-dependent oxidoreductase [Acidimicrobiales bacterium]